MKEFFQYQLHTLIPPIFDTQHLHHLTWPCTPHSFVRSTSAIVTILLDSVCVYKDFAYTPLPTPEDFHSIHVARDCILSIHAHFKWRLAPTTHYMTNHAILEAEEDGTAYNTLQEGVEHKNQDDKHEARVTVKGSDKPAPHEHMLNQQDLRLTLTYLGYAPPSHTPINVTPHNNVALHIKVTLPNTHLLPKTIQNNKAVHYTTHLFSSCPYHTSPQKLSSLSL